MENGRDADQVPTRSRRNLLNRAGSVLVGMSAVGLAGCTAVNSSDGTQAESGDDTPDRAWGNGSVSDETIDGPSEAGSSLAGTAGGRPNWIDTNMSFAGWYNARDYNPGGLQYRDDTAFFYNDAGFSVHVKFSGGSGETYHIGQSAWLTGKDKYTIKMNALGSSEYLNAELSGYKGHEIWIEGTIHVAKYWVGTF